MAANWNPPVLVEEIPAQVINEGASFTLDLNQYIQSPDTESGSIHFAAQLSDERALPQGLICTDNGMLSGIPASGTQGSYEVEISAKNDGGTPLSVTIELTIKPRFEMKETNQYFTGLKAKVWEALGEGSPLPELKELIDRPITASDVYYLLERFSTFIVWDVYNLDKPGELKPLTLEGVSPHYHVYDRGSCLVATPKDLFSHERTMEDGLKTAKAMAGEVYRRHWAVEFSGLDKMVRACWVEIQLLGEKHGKPLEVMHYNPSAQDIDLYLTGIKGLGLDKKNA